MGSRKNIFLRGRRKIRQGQYTQPAILFHYLQSFEQAEMKTPAGSIHSQSYLSALKYFSMANWHALELNALEGVHPISPGGALSGAMAVGGRVV